jgi:hypothetical protein
MTVKAKDEKDVEDEGCEMKKMDKSNRKGYKRIDIKVRYE